MLKKYSLVLLLSMVTVLVFGQKPVWEIGKGDNSASEFTLAPSDYSKFLAKDFGWEDRFFALGFSKQKRIFLMFYQVRWTIGEEHLAYRESVRMN